MEKEDERPKVLVVAGFDPSGGAGILADIKTLEMHGVYGYAVCTGMTWQNEKTISRIHWYTPEEIIGQIDLCHDSISSEGMGSFDYVKIGIGRSVAMIDAVVDHLRLQNPAVRVVLDPVIRASSGMDFWEGMDGAGFEKLAAKCYLLTPNWEEMGWLYPGEDIFGCCRRLSVLSNLYLKGGHNPMHPGRDYLWSGGEPSILEPSADIDVIHPKHGSGCVMASALTANLAIGYSLPEAARRSKRYIEEFLTSNKTLLGWHRTAAITA